MYDGYFVKGRMGLYAEGVEDIDIVIHVRIGKNIMSRWHMHLIYHLIYHKVSSSN